MKRTIVIVLANIVLIVLGVVGVLGGYEIYLRRNASDYDLRGAGYEKPWFRNNPGNLAEVFTVDPEFGFRPHIPGPHYNEFGTLKNSYATAKPEGKTRILFLGDSVTRIGFIVDAIKNVYGEQHYEYWNAGVDSFSTIQELKFYQRYNHAIKPDHVILTFHNNDYETTPIVFLDRDGNMVLYSPFVPRRLVNAWLFRKSHLYRHLLGVLIARSKDHGHAGIAAEIRDGLDSFGRELAGHGIRFSVLVHPVLNPRDAWLEQEVTNHETVLGILDELGIQHFDLTDPLWQALADGIDPKWDMWKDDKAHPSREVSRCFAEYLKAQGLLKEHIHGEN